MSEQILTFILYSTALKTFHTPPPPQLPPQAAVVALTYLFHRLFLVAVDLIRLLKVGVVVRGRHTLSLLTTVAPLALLSLASLLAIDSHILELLVVVLLGLNVTIFFELSS